jgi:hypothetical protein
MDNPSSSGKPFQHWKLSGDEKLFQHWKLSGSGKPFQYWKLSDGEKIWKSLEVRACLSSVSSPRLQQLQAALVYGRPH